MANDTDLREHVIALLAGGQAHDSFDEISAEIPINARSTRVAGRGRSPWEIVEHMRIALWDILEFVRNPSHVSPEYPKGYWPASAAPRDAGAWDRAVDTFRGDMKAFTALVADESTDLFAPIPHGDGHTVLREALLAADHNAYHIGQLAQLAELLK
jgi:hypothetical protein